MLGKRGSENERKTTRLSIDLSSVMMQALERRSKTDHQSKAGILRAALRSELREEISLVTKESAEELSGSGKVK